MTLKTIDDVYANTSPMELFVWPKNLRYKKYVDLEQSKKKAGTDTIYNGIFMFIRSSNPNKYKIVKLSVNVTKNQTTHTTLANIQFYNLFTTYIIGNNGIFLF